MRRSSACWDYNCGFVLVSSIDDASFRSRYFTSRFNRVNSLAKVAHNKALQANIVLQMLLEHPDIGEK